MKPVGTGVVSADITNWSDQFPETAGEPAAASSCETDKEVKGCVSQHKNSGHCLRQLCQLCGR